MEYTDKLDQILALLKEISAKLDNNSGNSGGKSAPKKREAEKFTCFVQEDEHRVSASGEWYRYRVKTTPIGFSSHVYADLWVRADKSDQVVQGGTVEVEGRLDSREHKGKTYWSIFADHVFASGEQPIPEEDEEDDVPF